jgi:Na+-driven multidrug efflux pump
VFPIARKTARLSWLLTMLLTLPVVLFPHQMLYPLLGGQDMTLVTDAQPIFWVLVGILTVFSIGAIYLNALIGTGATYYALKMQVWCTIGYLLYIYIVVNLTTGGLPWAWASEIFYWGALLVMALLYLRSKEWYAVEV